MRIKINKRDIDRAIQSGIKTVRGYIIYMRLEKVAKKRATSKEYYYT